MIFNRWGQLVFESNSQEEGWDGTFKGKKVCNDVYGYYLKVSCTNGEEYIKKGNDYTFVRELLDAQFVRDSLYIKKANDYTFGRERTIANTNAPDFPRGRSTGSHAWGGVVYDDGTKRRRVAEEHPCSAHSPASSLLEGISFEKEDI